MPNCLIDPERDCFGLKKAELLEKQFDEYKAKSSDTHHQLFERMRNLEIANGKRDEQYNAIIDRLDELSRKVDSAAVTIAELEKKPARRWEGIVDKAVWAILAAVITFILTQVGL